jgi:hypothetical protein
MNQKKYTQFGTFSVIALLPILIVFGILSIKSGINGSSEFIIMLLVALTFLICLLTFYKLTITVSSTQVSFKMGIGLWCKSYKLSEIASCKPVKNPFFWGIGIRMLPNSWLYNVSGFKAIELKFKNRTSVIRIGTNRPEEISELVELLLKGEETPVQINPIKANNRLNLFWLIGVFILVAAIMVMPSITETKVNLAADKLKIKSIYGLSIPYNTIEELDTVSKLPAISFRSNGYALGETLIGYFRLKDGSTVKLFVKTGLPLYVRIKSKDNPVIYLNFKSRQETVGLYNQLKNYR